LHRQVNVCSVHPAKFLPWALRSGTLVTGVRQRLEGCGDRVTELISATSRVNLYLWPGAF